MYTFFYWYYDYKKIHIFYFQEGISSHNTKLLLLCLGELCSLEQTVWPGPLPAWRCVPGAQRGS